MGPTNFSIILNNPQANYYAGQTVTGRTEFDLTENLKLKAIIVHFVGISEVDWFERGSNHTSVYHGDEMYINTKIIIDNGKDAWVLQPGKHSYPFQTTLPLDIPSSFESYHGHVRYTIKVTLDRHWVSDNHCKKFFTVTRLVDLNNHLESMTGVGNHTEKTLCCMCCKSPPIKASVQLQRCGYVAGEFITFTAEIDNQSNREMNWSMASLIMRITTMALLTMEVTYHARTKSRVNTTYIRSRRHPAIQPGGTDSWVGEKLGIIPPLPPSFLEGCKIIDIHYYLSIIVEPSGIAFDLNCPVEVIIGNIPYKSVAQEHGYNIPALPTGPAPEAPEGIYSDASTSGEQDIAFPPMRMSVFGKINTKEHGDTCTFGDDTYAPVYTFYDWNMPDRAEPSSSKSPAADDGQ